METKQVDDLLFKAHRIKMIEKEIARDQGTYVSGKVSREINTNITIQWDCIVLEAGLILISL